MAITANTTSTYDVTGNREDLADVISMLPTIDYPFYMGCADGPKPKNVKVEWQIDALPTPGSNAAVEGDVQGTLIAIVPTSRVYNFTQIQKKEYSVTGTQDEVIHAGTSTETAHQELKYTEALMGDAEYAFLREVYSTTASGAGDESNARKMKGALNWLTTNVSKAPDATIASDGTITGGTPRTLGEDLIKEVCQNIATSGGKPNIAYCGLFQKGQLSKLQNSGNYRRVMEEKKMVAVVDIYVNDFLQLAFKWHRNMPTDVVFIPDMKYWKKRTLRPMFKKQLASTADGTVYRHLVEHTLESTNEAASGRIVNLTTS